MQKCLTNSYAKEERYKGRWRTPMVFGMKPICLLQNKTVNKNCEGELLGLGHLVTPSEFLNADLKKSKQAALCCCWHAAYCSQTSRSHRSSVWKVHAALHPTPSFFITWIKNCPEYDKVALNEAPGFAVRAPSVASASLHTQAGQTSSSG